MSMNMRSAGSLWSLLAMFAVATRPLIAQDAAVVEGIAPLLQAEDARQWAPGVLEAATFSPELLVRRTAAMSIGRIGDLRGTALLIPMLQDRDSTLHPTVAFALGLLRDTAAVAPLIARLTAMPMPTLETAKAIVTALTKIGGPAASEMVARVLNNTANLTLTGAGDVLVRHAALESWRLGPEASSRQLIALAESSDDELRWRAVFTLGRIQAPAAGPTFLNALQDQHPTVRMYAAKALTRSYAASANLEPESVIALLARAARDDNAGVRIGALGSLGTYRSPEVADQVISQLGDPVFNVQVEAARTLGLSGGAVAVAQLSRIVREGKGTFAVRQQALLGLARISADSFRFLSASWTASPRWPERATAAEGWGWVAPGPDVSHPDFFADPDGRVAAAALQGWLRAVPGPDAQLLAAARGLLNHRDVVVRTLAAEAVARAPVANDIVSLTAAYDRALNDSIPDAAISALRALRTLAGVSGEDADAVNRLFLSRTSRPADYVLRLWAEAAWPAVAQRWGPAFPIQTGRTLQDYREIARRFVAVPESPDAHPHVFIETDQRDVIEIELLGPEAPLTVVNFLTLMDRHFFDNGRWHRVVPGLVAQDGDPRGDGWGGPGYAIRDEINQRPFDGYQLGMALSGPDTGGSQFFLTLGPQPHLDGRFTVFGRVVGSPTSLLRVTQGDPIRLIRR